MGDFNNYKLFKNVGIRSSDNKLIVMNVNKSNNVSFYSSDGGTNNIDVMSINSIINKSQNEDLNLSSLNGTTINPVITINNNHNDCRIMTNLNVYGNVNITKNLNVSNTVVNHNLIIPKYDNDNSLLSNVIGSIYYNTTENMYEGYSNDGWQPLGGFSKTKDAIIHKNVNVLQNINCTDKITSNVNIINHNLIIPTHNKDSILLSNTLGSIYYNTTENMYEGFSNEGWQPLGGFSKSKDATIYKNLNVLGNLNITGNMNQINSTQITVNDKNIVLASNNNADNHAEDGGIILQGATQKSLLWKSANGWKSSEKITAPHLDTVANQLLIGNTQVGLNLNFSGNNLHINGNVPKAGQVLIGTNSEVKWADTDYTLVNNQLIKVITETASASGIFGSASVLDLSSSNSYNQTYTTHDGYTLNNDTKKIIIIFNFAVVDSNLVSKIKLEVLIDNVSKKTVIFKNMTGNQINDFVKYFTLTSTEYGSGSKTIKFKFTDMNNTGTIKIFTEDGTSVKQPTITLQEIGDQNIKTILDETRGSKSDQIAKILVNTNATATTQILNTSQTTNYVYPYELHSSYTPSVSDTGTIIIIVNFALYISFNNNLTSKLKLELLLNNGSDTTIPQERKIILQEMNSNRSYEYTKYFSISKTDFGTGNKIELRFTDMNNSGNIKLFTNDDTNVKQPTVTIQEIGSTTGWGSSIENIPIGQTISADGSFNKVVVKNNLNVSGNINLTNGGMIKTTGIGSFGSINCGDGNITNVGNIDLNTISADNGNSFEFGSNWTAIGRTCTDLGTISAATSITTSKLNINHTAYSNALITVKQDKTGHLGGYPLGNTISTHHPDGTITIYKESELTSTDRISNGGGNTNCLLSLISDFGVNNSNDHLGGSIIFTTGTKNESETAGHVKPFASIYGGRVGAYTNFLGEIIFYVSEEANTTDLNPVMTITGHSNGASFSPRVGIGVSSPSYPLHIAGSVSATVAASGHRFRKNGAYIDSMGTNTTHNVTARIADIWITDTYVLNASDRRIKKNIIDVPDNLALEQLRSIPCRYYEYIDIFTRGTDQTIGFIAQEVKSIIPMAVSLQKNIIPNVYKVINCNWTSVNDKFSMNSTDLPNVNGVKYKFYVSNTTYTTDASDTTDPSDEKEIELTGNSDNTFTFDTQYTNVFCYGSEVDDFHTVDKNKLFTLNFSATQEIDRIQQTHITKIASLETEKQEQQNEINTLKTENSELKSVIDKLKTANSFEEFKNSL